MEIIVKQANGKHALFDLGGANIFLIQDSSVEEIRNFLIQRETTKIDADIISFFHNRISKTTGPEDPWYDTVVNLE